MNGDMSVAIDLHRLVVTATTAIAAALQMGVTDREFISFYPQSPLTIVQAAASF